MSISQISPNSLTSANTYVSPYTKTTEQQSSANQQATQDAQKTSKTTQTDTVTFSQQALQMVASNNNTKTEATKTNTTQQWMQTPGSKG